MKLTRNMSRIDARVLDSLVVPQAVIVEAGNGYPRSPKHNAATKEAYQDDQRELQFDHE
jgi:hypothetical protein